MATVRVRKRKDGSAYSQGRYRLDGVESSASIYGAVALIPASQAAHHGE